MFKTSDTFTTFVASPLLTDAEFRALCKWLVTRNAGDLNTPAVKLAARVIADDEARQHSFHDLKKQQAKARKEKAEKAENSTSAENSPSIPFHSVPIHSVPIHSNNNIHTKEETKTKVRRTGFDVKALASASASVDLSDELFIYDEKDGLPHCQNPVLMAVKLADEPTEYFYNTMKKRLDEIGAKLFLQELLDCKREYEAGEEPRCRGEAINARMSKLAKKIAEHTEKEKKTR